MILSTIDGIMREASKQGLALVVGPHVDIPGYTAKFFDPLKVSPKFDKDAWAGSGHALRWDFAIADAWEVHVKGESYYPTLEDFLARYGPNGYDAYASAQ